MELLDKAMLFAIERHSGQRRKLQNTPYILHPMEVVSIVGTMTDDQETLAASVLHDTVEDAGVTFDDIEDRFGKRVALLVMTETENKREERPPSETWHIRKEETLIILAHTKDIAVKMMWLGDKLSNMRSFYREYLKKGNDLWLDFNQTDPIEQAWYYRTIAKCLPELQEFDAYKEYVRLTEIVFETVKENKEYEIF